MTKFFFGLTAFSSVMGGLVLLISVASDMSAPQQAAGAAVALGLAVIPYVFARCIQQFHQHDALMEGIGTLTAAVREQKKAPAIPAHPTQGG